MPSIRCGIACGPELSVVTVSSAVTGLTSIFALTTTQSHGGLLGRVARVVLEVEGAGLDRVDDR